MGTFLNLAWPVMSCNGHFRCDAVVASFKHGPGTREVGQLAVWSVTSAKPGNGVDMLRDGREDTYWQSDGMQPHLVDISFQKKVPSHRWFACSMSFSWWVA